ncbi:hypothetical protein EDD21DRAFT_361873 [Dissophora ornata]|nr:hypothetical protein EDD21DRAFT_361873 [Dissophora ornata]
MGQNNSTPSRASRRSRSLSQGQAHNRHQAHHPHHPHHPHPAPLTLSRSSPIGAPAAPPPSPLSPPPPPLPLLSPPPPAPLSDIAAPPPHTAHSLPQSHVHSQTHVRPQPRPHHDPQQPPARVQNHMLQPSPQPQPPLTQQQQQLPEQTLVQTQPAQSSGTMTPGTAAIAPSRVVRSTTRRRRLLAAFYPLLSRNSNSTSSSANSTTTNNNNTISDNNNNINNNNNYTSYNSNNNGGINRSSIDNSSASNRAIQVIPELRQPGLHPRHRQPERPHHTPTRSQTLPSVPSYPSSPNARTPRGVSRVQRRYDEQSIRSFRSSSSRSSSLLAIPASSSTASQTTAPLHQQHVRQSLSQHHGQLSSEPMDVDQDVILSSHTAHAEPLPLPFDASHDLQTDHIISGQVINLGARATNMTSLGDGIRLEAGLFVARSNPRVGTSISSSLLPIRPDSEDEDDDSLSANDVYSQHRATEHEALTRGLINVSSDTNSLHARYRSDAEQHDDQTGFHEILASQRPGSGPGPRTGAAERRPRASRPSRYPPPEIVQDLIHRQIAQGMAEAAANRPSELPDFAEALPARNSSSTSLETVNSSTVGGSLGEGVSNADSSTSSARQDAALEDDLFVRRSTGIHRRRLRSPSLRGLLGFQPMNGVTAREPVRGSGIDRGFTPVQHDEGVRSEDVLDRRRFVESQLPFITRILSEISRGLRGQQGHSAEGDREDQGSSTLNPALGATNDTSIVSESVSDIHSTANEAPRVHSTSPDTTSSPSGSSGSEANTSPPLRRHTMVRFIQIGGGAGLATFGASRSRSGSAGSGQGSPRSERSEDSPRVGRDELADAILMFLSNPASGNASDAESSETTLMEGGETPRARTRRPPWVVFTLSGACKCC